MFVVFTLITLFAVFAVFAVFADWIPAESGNPRAVPESAKRP